MIQPIDAIMFGLGILCCIFTVIGMVLFVIDGLVKGFVR